MTRRRVMPLLLLLGLAACLAVGQEQAPGSFCIVALPDTQRYIYRTPEILAAQIEWIIHNREAEGIAFVTHLGDIVEKNTPEEWVRADRILSRLDGVVPYGLCVGNHDMHGPTGDASLFQGHFPASRYKGREWYGGSHRDNANSYQLFTSGRLDLIILHLECNAPDGVLDWAGGVLDEHADRRAIIATHMYLGARKDVKDTEKGRCLWKKCHGEQGNTPQQMWEKRFSKHANVILVLSGDQSTPQTHRQAVTGEAGNVVHECLSDYKQAEGGISGYLRIYRFHPKENRIEVTTYSPNLNKSCETTKRVDDPGQHSFELEVDLGGAGQDDHEQEGPG